MKISLYPIDLDISNTLLSIIPYGGAKDVTSSFIISYNFCLDSVNSLIISSFFKFPRYLCVQV